MKTHSLIALGLLAFLSMTPAVAQTTQQKAAVEPLAVEKAEGAKAVEGRHVTIGTGPVAGVYFPAGGAIQRMVNKGTDRHGLKAWVESTDGSLANLKALRAGTLDFAVVQSDWQYHAVKGTSAFKADGPFEELRAVLALHAEPLTVIARAGADITSLYDLEGREVSFGEPGTGTRVLMDQVVEAFGWDPKQDFKSIKELSLVEQIEALCDGEVDAIAFAAVHPNGLVQDATNRCETIILPISGEPAEHLIRNNPYLVRTRIPGGLYPNADKDIETIGVRATLVSTTRVDADMAAIVARSVSDNLDAFKAQHPAFSGLTEDNLFTGGLTAPFHDGVTSLIAVAPVN